MPSGTLGQADLSAATNTTVYTVPSAKVATFTVNVVNRAATSTLVRLAIASTSTPGNSEWIEYDALLSGNQVLERTGLVASAAENLVAYSSAANVSVNVYGYEE